MSTLPPRMGTTTAVGSGSAPVNVQGAAFANAGMPSLDGGTPSVQSPAVVIYANGNRQMAMTVGYGGYSVSSGLFGA